ncbi:HU domain-containing protein [Arcticibacterium luteifluviistationis]|uniref:SPOR domain-containing protein n=1 Tax=Arcticibacterium luteifluviistationis TaxID=1784714 RepID=A0A2Z4G739_9BACT|nr:SPOR domain-containing protein [Arcticibacterium luteifluviistationis]AWV96870.1 hypothetical protein DJ013_01195 [Arcticibacterium luteifluviistationis]
MINFDKYLRELLYEEDFFIVPSLGAFIATFTQAEITEEGKLIEPTKSFDFNGLLHSDDNDKFINYVKAKENISKGEVIDQLKNYLLQFKSGLAANGKMVLADVCTIKVSEQGSFEGEFDPELNYYAKPSFSETVIPISTHQRIRDEISHYPTVQGEELSEQQENAEYTGDLEYEEDERRNKWLKYLLYLIPLFLILGSLYYVILYKPFASKTETSVSFEEKDSTEVLSEIYADSVYIDADGEIDENVNPADVIEEIKDGLIAQEEKVFQVSAGLFSNKENAEKLVARMEAAGFNAEIKIVNGMRRVYVPVNGIDDAEIMSNKIEQFTGDKSVYFDENGISNR